MKRQKITVFGVPIAILAVGVFAIPGAASVANAQNAAADDDAFVIDEVIVTSRKREESLFVIPVAVTAFSAQDIVNAGLEELPDLNS